MMQVHDLSGQEIDVIWEALDIDKSGTVEFSEFNRKLEMYGVRTRSKEEVILSQIIEAASRKMSSLSELFEAFDL
jgi:Ca2+-binding EF-hand superfamily protein